MQRGWANLNSWEPGGKVQQHSPWSVPGSMGFPHTGISKLGEEGKEMDPMEHGAVGISGNSVPGSSDPIPGKELLLFYNTNLGSLSWSVSAEEATLQDSGPVKRSDRYTQQWNLRHPLFSTKLLAGSKMEAGQCGPGKRRGSAHLQHWGDTPLPQLQNDWFRPACCKSRQGVTSLDWKSMPVWLGLAMQGTQHVAWLEPAEIHTSKGWLCWKIGVWSWANFFYFIFMPSNLRWWGEGASELGNMKHWKKMKYPTSLL